MYSTWRLSPENYQKQLPITTPRKPSLSTYFLRVSNRIWETKIYSYRFTFKVSFVFGTVNPPPILPLAAVSVSFDFGIP